MAEKVCFEISQGAAVYNLHIFFSVYITMLLQFFRGYLRVCVFTFELPGELKY